MFSTVRAVLDTTVRLNAHKSAKICEPIQIFKTKYLKINDVLKNYKELYGTSNIFTKNM